MDTKLIIDTHFTEYYNYYRRVCYTRLKDCELYEELLHDTYLGLLKVKDSVIIEFNNIGKLHKIGNRVLFSLIQKKNTVKQHKDGNTSNLFKHNNTHDVSDLFNDNVIKESEYSELEYQSLDNAIKTLLNKKETSLSVMIFLQVNETSIYELHKNSGISREYLTKEYNKGKRELKKHIEHDKAY